MTFAARTMQLKRAKAGRQPPPPTAELPKRCLQRGSDAKRHHRSTKRSRFSPGKHIGAEGRGVKNDAFNKVNGARRRRRHWSASRLRLSPSPNPSLKPKAEERQSAEEPTGGPAADPKTWTSRTAARPGTSGGGAASHNPRRRRRRSHQRRNPGPGPSGGGGHQATGRPRPEPSPGLGGGAGGPGRPQRRRRGRPASGPGRRERRRPGPAAGHARDGRPTGTTAAAQGPPRPRGRPGGDRPGESRSAQGPARSGDPIAGSGPRQPAPTGGGEGRRGGRPGHGVREKGRRGEERGGEAGTPA